MALNGIHDCLAIPSYPIEFFIDFIHNRVYLSGVHDYFVIMPKRFVRIRKYGIYNPIVKRNMDLLFETEQKPSIEELEQEKDTKQERLIRLTGFDSGKCPKCKMGRMIVVENLPRIRSPDGHLPSILLTFFK